MSTSSTPKMMSFHVPDDPAVLRAFGAVSIRHSHLDYILRMTIKTLAGITIEEALDATEYQGPGLLRERIGKLAKQALGEGAALLRLQAILTRCGRATARRNELIHNIIGKELDAAEPQVRTRHHAWAPLPTVGDLEALARELELLTNELNWARLDGFLSEALAAAKARRAGG